MPTESPSSIYTVRFFSEQVSGSATSASIVVPLVLSMLNVKSVVDVGCGVGPWAAEFLANGVPEVWGIDGDYVDLSQLRIPQDRFLARDLTKSIQIDRTFDLAVCLEVAEHLPESRADGLIADLTSVAPCILFSAAVPGAGGTHHVNEQYLSYWTERFLKRGYEGVDAIRPWILGNDSVEWFYQQNTVLFAAPGHPLLGQGIPKAQTIIHQDLYERRAMHPKFTLSMVAKAFPGALSRSIRFHLGLD